MLVFDTDLCPFVSAHWNCMQVLLVLPWREPHMVRAKRELGVSDLFDFLFKRGPTHIRDQWRLLKKPARVLLWECYLLWIEQQNEQWGLKAIAERKVR